MKFLVAAGVLVGAVLCNCPGALGLDCTSTASLQEEQEKCFRNAGLTGIESGQLQTVIQNDPEYFCRNMEEYKSAVRCSLDLASGCLVELGQSGSRDRILPSTDRMIQGLSRMCGRIQDIDINCVKSKLDDLRSCGYRKGRELSRSRHDSDIICKIYQASTECMSEQLRSCGCRTTEAYVNVSRDYMNPPDCSSASHPMVACSADGKHFTIGGRAAASGASLFLVLAAFLLSLFRL